MGCTAFAPDLTALDRARHLYETIPPGLFRTTEDSGASVPWRVAPEPFKLSPETARELERIGADLLAFYRALNNLYNRSARGSAPSCIAAYLDQGKPEHVVRLSRQNRSRMELPGIIRPDLLLTPDGFAAAELDSVPGGMGFTGAMSEAYCRVGIETLGGAAGMLAGFAAMVKARTQNSDPVAAIVVSDESRDYRPEMRWLADALRRSGELIAYLCEPQDIVFTEEALFVRLPDGREEKIDVLYRNFELFDLLNVPKYDLMLYAARHQRVVMTPPPKAQLEEKMAFALLHLPMLRPLWKAELGTDVLGRLLRLLPQTWVLDPAPVPPQAEIFDLTVGGQPVADWMRLAELRKSDRDYVIKPSGFSELAWGSRGVRVANDLPREEWAAALRSALDGFHATPYVLQRFHKARRIRTAYFDPVANEIREFDGRVRLCPYYFVAGEHAKLGGVLATIAPADKRLIHGMAEAVMTPCMREEAAAA